MRSKRRVLGVAGVVVSSLTFGVEVAAEDGDRGSEPPEVGRSDTGAKQTIAEDLTVVGDLEVAPSSGVASIQLSDPGGQHWQITTFSDDFNVRDANTGRYPFFIKDGAPNNALAVMTNGNVGIRTQFPSTDLTIEDNGSIQVMFRNTNFDKPDWKFTNNDNMGNFRITVDGSGYQEFDLTRTGDLSLTGSLRVCSRGAASASGTCSGAVVNLPDYVFSPGYEPMSLGELESFVAANRHLPGVLSAAEAAREGIDLAELQIGVLRNVEELLLHTIDQQRTLDGLASELEAQRAANADLELRLAALEARLAAD